MKKTNRRRKNEIKYKTVLNEELDLYMQLSYKQEIEIAEEQALKFFNDKTSRQNT